jgi:hypothetical protein
MQNNQNKSEDAEIVAKPTPQVNEPGLVNISGHIRVFDPNTDETLVESRE